MLPFLKRDKEQSADASASEPIKRKPDEGAEEFDSLEAAAEDLIKAVKSENIKDVASALRAAFELCDSEPHVEGPHENKE